MTYRVITPENIRGSQWVMAFTAHEKKLAILRLAVVNSKSDKLTHSRKETLRLPFVTNNG